MDDVIVQLIGKKKILTKTKVQEMEPYFISHAVIRTVKEKQPINQLLGLKRQRNCHGHLKPFNCFLNKKYIKEYKIKCEFSGVDFEVMASDFCGFVGSHSPRDNPTHVKEGYLMTLLQG